MKRDSSVVASVSMPEKVSPINSPNKSDVDDIFKIPCTPKFGSDSSFSDVTLENCSHSENIQDNLDDFNSESDQDATSSILTLILILIRFLFQHPGY